MLFDEPVAGGDWGGEEKSYTSGSQTIHVG